MFVEHGEIHVVDDKHMRRASASQKMPRSERILIIPLYHVISFFKNYCPSNESAMMGVDISVAWS